jgi:hypothetical protein
MACGKDTTFSTVRWIGFQRFLPESAKAKKDPVYPVNPVNKEIRSNPYLTKIIVGGPPFPPKKIIFII